MQREIGVINHYRSSKKRHMEFGQRSASLEDAAATVKDEDFLPSVPLVLKALQERFGEDPEKLLKRLSEKRPPSQEEASRFAPTNSQLAPMPAGEDEDDLDSDGEDDSSFVDDSEGY